MIVKALQIFTEYFGMILCIHKVANKKVSFSWRSLLDFSCWVALVFLGENIRFGKLLLYTYLFAYIRVRIVNNWKLAIKPFAVTMCAIPMLQIVLYAIISDITPDIFSIYLWGIIINTIIIIFFTIWKGKYLHVLINKITQFKYFISFILIICLFRYLTLYYSEYKVINAYFIEQIVICFLIVALMLILWINSENEKKHKMEELRTYQLYTKTFEDAVTTIRMKQHEFDNHINAIKCMRYTIQDTEKLIIEQDKYCDEILKDNKYNKLLKSSMSPILVGYLYFKFTTASSNNVNIEYEIQDVNIECIAINDLIEIIGILFDNAVEALEEQENKELEVKMLKKDNKFIISIANVNGWKTNSEIEKFFEYGYSTKGNGHGIGLYRANMLMKKYKTCLQVENIAKNNLNYLCFKIMF